MIINDMKWMDASLDYDDITLVSHKISNVNSRDNVNTSCELFPGIVLDVPIIASPMVDVVDIEIAVQLRQLGGFAFLHRFNSIEEQCVDYIGITLTSECGCAIGLDEWDRLDALYNIGCRYYVLDIANCAHQRVYSFMLKIQKAYKDAMFIVGNIVSNTQFKWCQELPNVYGVRCGVGGGKGCTTKNATGIYQGAVSLLQSCKKAQGKAKVIADGGVGGPSDFCKALACGANAVCLGSLIANCQESPAEMSRRGDVLYKIYRGSASYDNQLRYKENPKYIEGKTVLLEHRNESLKELVTRLVEGLRSSMAYFDAYTLEEYCENTEFALVY